MIPKLIKSRSGPPTLLVDSLYLHSQYDPVNEAKRFVENLTLSKNIEFILLLEPGLGYCIPFIKEIFTNSKLLVIHVSDYYSTSSNTFDKEAHGVWYPSQTVDLIHFLEKEIPEGSVCQLLEWRPAATAYGKQYGDLLALISQFLEREAANIRTTAGFGKRWLKNSIRNLNLVQKPLYFTPGSIPVVVTGAGPGLETAIPLILKAVREGPLCIVAAASSVPALLAHTIMPTLSVATDGGTWAGFHLVDQFRTGLSRTGKDQGASIPLAFNLTAKTISQAAQVPQIIISDGSIWQNSLLEHYGIPFLQLPQRGTVSATIIDMALLLTDGPIYMAGIDLASRDIQTHVRPYGLDFYNLERENHLSPLYSLQFERHRMISDSKALAIYANWFESYFADKMHRIRVLGNRHSLFPELLVSDQITWEKTIEPSFYGTKKKQSAITTEKSVSILLNELRNNRAKNSVQQELSYLLKGNRNALSVPEIESLLYKLFKIEAKNG